MANRENQPGPGFDEGYRRSAADIERSARDRDDSQRGEERAFGHQPHARPTYDEHDRPGRSGGYSAEGYGGAYDNGVNRGRDYKQGGATYDQQDYSPAARRSLSRDANGEHDHEPHYRRWRDEQLAGHDRDYARWRDQQASRYDADYRGWRSERDQAFARDFHSWRQSRGSDAGAEMFGGDNSPTGSTGDASGLTGAVTGASGAEAGLGGPITGVSDSGGGATGAAQISGGSGGVAGAVSDAAGMGRVVQASYGDSSPGARGAGEERVSPASTGSAMNQTTPGSVQSVTDGHSGGEERRDDNEASKH